MKLSLETAEARAGLRSGLGFWPPRLEFKAAAPGPIQTVLETSPPDKDPVTQTTSGGDFVRLLSASLRTSAVKVGSQDSPSPAIARSASEK
jgi:hypothetical protein